MVTESSPTRRRRAGVAASLTVVSLLLAACGGGSDEPEPVGSASAAASAAAAGDLLLDAQRLTVLDQPLSYPAKQPAQVSSAMVQLEPGQETGWHKHKVPVYVYVLEGTLTTEYDAGVTKEFTAGSAFLEAEDVWLNSTNKGEDPVRLLTVYMGAKGAKNLVERAS